jgi:hypothetical protein
LDEGLIIGQYPATNKNNEIIPKTARIIMNIQHIFFKYFIVNLLYFNKIIFA